MGKPIGNLEEKRGHENLFLGGYKFGSRENPDMRCFSLFLQKVALYQLCEGTCRQPSFMVLWVELRSPLARPQHGHVFKDHVLGGHARPWSSSSGCAQQLSGGIWNTLPSHMGLLFLKPTLLVGNMERKEGVSCAAQ